MPTKRNTNINKSKTLAQSVGFGIEDGSIRNIGSLSGPGILGQLAENAHLPNITDADDREEWNEKSFCELCDTTFNLRTKRHHCRKCKKSVCQSCSGTKRQISKKDQTLYRVCDYCDTQLSNFKLEQNQNMILKAQEEQMEIYIQ
jgi:hypothetical protein